MINLGKAENVRKVKRFAAMGRKRLFFQHRNILTSLRLHPFLLLVLPFGFILLLHKSFDIRSFFTPRPALSAPRTSQLQFRLVSFLNSLRGETPPGELLRRNRILLRVPIPVDFQDEKEGETPRGRINSLERTRTYELFN